MDILTANIITLLVTGLLAFGVSFVLTPLVKKVALKRNWVVPPHPRRIHTKPMVSIGGVAIFAGFGLAVLVAVAVYGWLGPGWQNQDLVHIGLLLVGSSLIAGVSLVDDLKELPARLRLICQAVAAAIVVAPELYTPTRYLAWPAIVSTGSTLSPFTDKHVYFGAIIDSINVPGGALKLALLAIPFTLFWIVGMTNTVNWIDGLDGLAGGVVFIGATTLFVENIFVKRDPNVLFPLTSSLLALALACAILGFLPYNWHPAKIFMGDVGAMFLGYALAVISIIDGAKVAATLLVIGFPVLDVAWVITYRLLHKRSPFKPDRGHFHQRLLDLGLSQRQIVGIFYLICGVFGAVGIFVQDSVSKLIALVVLGLLLLPLFFYAASRQTRAEIKAAHFKELENMPINPVVPEKLESKKVK